MISRRRRRLHCASNPDVDPKTHPYIATGLSESKFGIPLADAEDVYRRALTRPHLSLQGIDCHIGSQLTDVNPFSEALQHVLGLVETLRRDAKIALKYVDVGGGLGITYDAEQPPTPADYGNRLRELWQGTRHELMTLICEPGRVIAGNAGVMLTQVLFRKRNQQKQFVIVDGAMNDLLRPSLYKAYHAIQPLVERSGSPEETVDVVGPICESGDFLARDRKLPEVHAGDTLCVMSAGAYGFTMASNYNSRPRAAEVFGGW